MDVVLSVCLELSVWDTVSITHTWLYFTHLNPSLVSIAGDYMTVVMGDNLNTLSALGEGGSLLSAYWENICRFNPPYRAYVI